LDVLSKFDDKQQRAIVALNEAPTITRAAEISNISKQTLYTYLENPEFKLAYLRYRAHAITQASVLLTSNMVQAAQWIVDAGENPGAMPIPQQKLRLQAARMILQNAHRFQSDELLLAEAENA